MAEEMRRTTEAAVSEDTMFEEPASGTDLVFLLLICLFVCLLVWLCLFVGLFFLHVYLLLFVCLFAFLLNCLA